MTDKLKYLLFFLMVTVGAYGGSTLFLSYLDRELLKGMKRIPSPAPGESAVARKASPPPPPADYSKVVTRRTSPVEQKEDTSKQISKVQKKPVLTSLNLKLLGTVVNESGLSWAIIQDLDRNSRQDMVSVGSVVAGATVTSIAKDRVVLNVDGREEVLVLGEEGVKTAGAGSGQEGSASTYVLNSDAVRRNLDNLPNLMTQARAELYFKDGNPEGFQVSQIQEGSLIKSAGFEEGDVIRKVNGQEVRSLEDAIALYQKYGQNDTFTIEILRGEKPKTLHVKIR